MTYFSNVVVNKDRQYSQSYGAPELVNYAYAIEEGDWLELFDSLGYSDGKKKTTAKHFHSFTGKEITKRTFQMRTKKALKLRKLENIKKEKELTEKKEKYQNFCTELLATLEIRITEVAEKIKKVVTIEDINDYKKNNEICNKAVGIVGYEFAKHLGWTNVLKTIKKQLF